MKPNKRFILSSIASYNGKQFSCMTSINQSHVKYDILEHRFNISSDLQWFSFMWRRREDENISYMCANVNIFVPFDEIEKLPVFKNIFNENKQKKGKEIEKEILKNDDIKQALIEKYSKKLGVQLYVGESEVTYVKSDRFCGYEKILQTLKENYPEDDFSEIITISDCIINAY